MNANANKVRQCFYKQSSVTNEDKEVRMKETLPAKVNKENPNLKKCIVTI